MHKKARNRAVLEIEPAGIVEFGSSTTEVGDERCFVGPTHHRMKAGTWLLLTPTEEGRGTPASRLLGRSAHRAGPCLGLE